MHCIKQRPWRLVFFWYSVTIPKGETWVKKWQKLGKINIREGLDQEEHVSLTHVSDRRAHGRTSRQHPARASFSTHHSSSYGTAPAISWRNRWTTICHQPDLWANTGTSNLPVAACVGLKIVIRHHYSERRFFPAALALLPRFFGSVFVNLGLVFLIQRGHTAHIFDSLRLSGFHTAFWQQSKKSAISCKVWLGPSQVPQSQLLKVVCFLVFFWNTPFSAQVYRSL